MSDIEATSEARAIAIYEAVNDDASKRTPWTHLSPGEWDNWRRAANLLKTSSSNAAVIEIGLENYDKITRLEGEAKVLRILLSKCVDVIDTLLDDADEGYGELLSLKEACAEAITPPRQWVAS